MELHNIQNSEYPGAVITAKLSVPKKEGNMEAALPALDFLFRYEALTVPWIGE